MCCCETHNVAICAGSGGYVINGSDMHEMLSMEADKENEGTEFYGFPHSTRGNLSLWDEGQSTLHLPRSAFPSQPPTACAIDGAVKTKDLVCRSTK